MEMAERAQADGILSDAPDHAAADALARDPERGVGGEGRTATGAGAAAAKTAGAQDYDVAIVGASLAGCTAALMLGRAGARVALLEQRPDADAYKRICTHYIQSSAVATLERLGILERMVQAGAVRSRGRLWTRWGWIALSRNNKVPSGVNLRREVLDPLVRQMAVETPGVELLLGRTVKALVRENGAVCGVEADDTGGQTLTLRARLVVGADGRDSRVAKLAEVSTKTVRHGRFAYGGYFEGPAPAGAPDASLWMLDPHMAAAFPTDSDLTFYAVMPTKDRLPEFKRDPEAALKAFVAAVPDAPPIMASRLVSPVEGKIDMTNVIHTPTAPGLALIGDAAGALDPLWGIGCGFAFQTAEWLADSVTPALVGAEPLAHGLKRYRRKHARKLRGHTAMILDYAGGRKFNPGERLLFSAAARDERLAAVFEAFGTRNIGPARMLATAFPRAMLVNARHALAARGGGSRAVGAESA
jgi:2-polyprenyl-6-methoxyphenol hydroxylase-like FAD-dependent oxidoreductase